MTKSSKIASNNARIKVLSFEVLPASMAKNMFYGCCLGVPIDLYSGLGF